MFSRETESVEGVFVWGGGDTCETGSLMREAELSHDLLDPGDLGKLRGSSSLSTKAWKPGEPLV